MNRRGFLLGAVTTAGLAVLPVAATAAAADQVVAQLQGQGYSEIRVSRTLLGRVRIVARGGGQRREIILNRATGEILRDYWSADSTSGRILRSDEGGESDREEPEFEASEEDDDEEGKDGSDDDASEDSGDDDEGDDGGDDGGDEGGGDDDD